MKPHVLPLQVGMALFGAVQAMHDVVPHVSGLVFCTHCPVQMC